MNITPARLATTGFLKGSVAEDEDSSFCTALTTVCSVGVPRRVPSVWLRVPKAAIPPSRTKALEQQLRLPLHLALLWVRPRRRRRSIPFAHRPHQPGACPPIGGSRPAGCRSTAFRLFPRCSPDSLRRRASVAAAKNASPGEVSFEPPPSSAAVSERRMPRSNA